MYSEDRVPSNEAWLRYSDVILVNFVYNCLNSWHLFNWLNGSSENSGETAGLCNLYPKKQRCMIGKYHNHTLQTNPRHREEEPQDTGHWLSQYIRKTVKVNATNALFPIKMIAKLEGHIVLPNKIRTKHRTPTNNERNNKKWINNNRTTALE